MTSRIRILTLVVLAAACASCQKVTLRHGVETNSVPGREDAAPPAPQPARAAAGERALAPPAKPAELASHTDTSGRDAGRVARLIGVLAPLSGKYAAYGKAYLDGAQLATDAFDAKRGPARVELVPADSRGEALPALAATRRLVATDGLVAILGSVLSLPTVVAGLQANCSRVPLLSNVATEEGIADIGPYVFHIGPSRQRAARSAADLVVFSLRRFRAAVLCPEDGDGRTLATAFGERLCDLGGEVVASESYAAGTTDFTAVARRLRASAPDVLYLPASVDETLLIAPALAVQGLSAPLVGTEEWSSDRLLRAAGLDLEGALLPAPDADASSTEMARFRDAYRARYARPDNHYAAAGYLGATRLLDLLAQDPGADRETLRRELEESLRGARASAGGTPHFLVVHDGEARPFETP